MAKTEQTTTAVATTSAGAVAAYNYGDDAGSGFENTKASDLSIPFLNVLQSNSPQVIENNPEGARPGMLFNSVTKELSKDYIFLPVHKEQLFVEWVKRDKGGGFVAAHLPESQEVKDAKARAGDDRNVKLEIGEHDLIDTYYVYGLVLSPDGLTQMGFGVLSFTSTKIKVYRDWSTSMYMVKGRPPLFAFRAKITTVMQKNDKGTFFNYNIGPFGDSWVSSLIPPTDDAGRALLEEAKSFRDMVISGVARAAYETATNAAGEDAPAAGSDAKAKDGKAPF